MNNYWSQVEQISDWILKDSKFHYELFPDLWQCITDKVIFEKLFKNLQSEYYMNDENYFPADVRNAIL